MDSKVSQDSLSLSFLDILWGRGVCLILRQIFVFYTMYMFTHLICNGTYSKPVPTSLVLQKKRLNAVQKHALLNLEDMFRILRIHDQFQDVYTNQN